MVLLDTEVDAENPRGQLSNPDAGDAFFARLDEAVEIARITGARLINTLCGLSLPGVQRELQIETLISRLKQASSLAEAEGITLLVEALNHFDNPGYLITNSKDGFEVVDAVNSPNVRFQYDLYHMQLMEGNLINTVRDNLDKIGHMQLADVPGRLPPERWRNQLPKRLERDRRRPATTDSLASNIDRRQIAPIHSPGCPTNRAGAPSRPAACSRTVSR